MKNAMDINRETAMRLWNKRYGKATKVKDFAGRDMVKAAYGDRNSDFGWNLDHILPKSQGGKDTDSNLICCHILTNDEKADKFPCFVANGKKFEIVKVQNHYEIKEVNGNKQGDEMPEDEPINFFDSAAAIRFYKKQKGIQNKKAFVGTIVIELNSIQSTAIFNFISEIFEDKNITFSKEYNVSYVIIRDYNMPQKEDTADLLDRCILLNTYLSYFFEPTGVIQTYNIFYGVHTDDSKWDALTFKNGFHNNNYRLAINELVKINSEANEKLANVRSFSTDYANYPVYEYNYIYTKLAENLKKLTTK